MNEIVKRKVGHMHECPADMHQEAELGGYLFCSSIKGLMIVGKGEFNLTAAPIYPVSITPMSKKKIIEIAGEEGQLGDVFYLDDATIYYIVSFAEHSYVFNELNTALSFMGNIVAYKTSALTDGFIREKLRDEV